MVTNVTKEWLLGESGTDGANANVGITGIGSGAPKYHSIPSTTTFPAGHVLRVFHKTSTADITVTSGTTIVTGCTQTLTPLSNTSKFLISHSFSGRYNSGSDTVFHVEIYYGGSAIGGKTNLNNFSTGNVNFPVSGSGSFLHSPSTASEIK